MTEYLITFNDEWVTGAHGGRRSRRRAVRSEVGGARDAGRRLLIFTNGGLDR